MSKGKGGVQATTRKWWFEDQSRINQLIASAIDGCDDDRRALHLTMEFVRQGRAYVGPVIPVGLAQGACDSVEVPKYPSLINWLEFFVVGFDGNHKSPIVRECRQAEADLFAYVASASTWGITSGGLVVCDANRPWVEDEDSQPFRGGIFYFKAVQ